MMRERYPDARRAFVAAHYRAKLCGAITAA